MKTVFTFFLAFLLLSMVFTGCSTQNEPATGGGNDISPEGLMAVYEALDWTPTGNVAVKLSTGEPPASNYLRPELIKDLVQSVSGTIVECNTAYGGAIKNISIGLASSKHRVHNLVDDCRLSFCFDTVNRD